MDIQFPQILFQIVNFGVVFGVLVYYLYKPVKKVLEKRSKKVEEGQKAAAVVLEEKKNLEDLKKKPLKDAEKEAAQLLEEANLAAAARRKELMAKAKDDIAAELSKERQAIKDELFSTKEHMRLEFNKAVFAVAEKFFAQSDKK